MDINIDWALLESGQKLQRERGARNVGEILAADGVQGMQSVEEHVEALLCHVAWEGRHGGLLLIQEYLKWHQQSRLGVPKYHQWADACLKLLSEKEVRMRTASGETLALLCQHDGLKLYDEKVAGPLLASIENNMTLERDGQAFLEDDEQTKKLAEKLLAGEAAQQIKQGNSRASRASSMHSSIFHDTAGWGTLETDVSCLQQIVEKCGAEFVPRLTAQGEVLELLCTGAVHMNRFVREIAFRALDAVVKGLEQAGSNKDIVSESTQDSSKAHAEFYLDSVALSSDLVARLGSGLCDEWPNVRMEASVALRTFLTSLQTAERRERFYHELLPKLCVNRYYVAVGVASYTRETWRLIIGDKGKETIAQWLTNIVPFYIMQTRVANSEARDAACKCIGELAARVDRNDVSSYAENLFNALIPRLSWQDAWEVKVSACSAVAEFVRAYPQHFNLSANFPRLVPSLSAILADTVWSVRAGAAMALGELVKASDDKVVGPILELCLDGLKSASKEVDERSKYGKDDLADLKRERDNDVVLHSNQNTIDCCAVGDLDEDDSEQLGKLSLSKIYNQAQRDTLEMGLNKWERTDGCLYLLRELALSGRWKGSDKQLEKALQLAGSASMLRHFVKHLTFLATLWKLLPDIATTIGMELFKNHLGNFIDSLAYSISCQEKLTVSAAQTCLLELNRGLGHEVFSECVRLHDAGLLDKFSVFLASPVGNDTLWEHPVRSKAQS